MRTKSSVLIIAVIVLAAVVFEIEGQNPSQYKFCATSKYENECSQLQRGKSEVLCQRVQDGIECAQRLINGTADFGIFSSENTLHLATLNWEGLTVIRSLAHRAKERATVDFESVVIVDKTHEHGLAGLIKKNFCHPGLHYDKSQKWSERFLKHFERTVVPINCTISESAAELETAALASYFGRSCRPGKWSHDIKEDARLKQRYSTLCDLCDSTSERCTYSTEVSRNHHKQALLCLINGGNVAYVAKAEAKEFFEDRETESHNFRYLCPNGTLQEILSNADPCVWLRQPWKTIIARSPNAVVLGSKIESWMTKAVPEVWEQTLRDIIWEGQYFVNKVTMQSPRDYARVFRPIPISLPLCETTAAWCTISPQEYEKCEIVKAGGISSGVYPEIECRSPVNGTVSCLRALSAGRADFVGIDSNFGYLARSIHNLTAALFFETEMEQYSSVVIVVRANSNFDRFEKLKKTKACFPEYGGIAAMAFINLGKNRGFFSQKECRYGRSLSNFFLESCAPGAKDLEHDPSNTNPASLCGLCKSDFSSATQNQRTNIVEDFGGFVARDISCAASPYNAYYGNRGALRCLSEVGDVAVVELQSIKEHAKALNLTESNYQIFCANGTLAAQPGFDVDYGCALTTIVDGEIVVPRRSRKNKGVVEALSAFDAYFQIDPDFKMYNIFAGEKHGLFKDSTIGLIAADEDSKGPMVENYIKLFSNLEACVQGNASGNLAVNGYLMLVLSFFLVISKFFIIVS